VLTKQYPEVMTIKQVAEYIQIDAQSIYKMAQRGKIPCAKIAGQWRFKKSILDEWLNQKIAKHETVQIFQGPIKVNNKAQE
jgi:excisionase family DNA binding protein